MQFQPKYSGRNYKIGAWNVNGFYSKDHPENMMFCVTLTKIFILFIKLFVKMITLLM